MSSKVQSLAFVVGAVAVLGMQSTFIVTETQQVLIEQFGDLKRAKTDAGLGFKIPFIDNVIEIEKRVLNLEKGDIQTILTDKKQLVVDAFARYKITNPIKFYQAVGHRSNAEAKVETILDSATRSVLGKAELNDVLSERRSVLMNEIKTLADAETKDFGVEVIDVRIRRADLPKENAQSIFNRMKAERKQQAAQFRAEGQEKAVEIKSKADRQSQVILAEARRDADIIRGEGDQERNSIYAKSYSSDPKFFEFYRSLKAYEKTLGTGDSDTSIIMSSDTEFLKYIKDGAK